MKIELSDQDVNLLLNILGDVPAKVSYNLLQNVSTQVATHNKRIQSLMAQAQADGAGERGVAPPNPQE